MTYGVKSSDLFLTAEDLSELDRTFEVAMESNRHARDAITHATETVTRARAQRDAALALVKKYEDEAKQFEEEKASARSEGVAIGIILSLALHFVSMGFGP